MMRMQKMNRRDFLKWIGLGATMLALPKTRAPEVESAGDAVGAQPVAIVEEPKAEPLEFGLTQDEVFEQLFEGIRRRSALILDNVGIVVRMDDMPSFPARARRYLHTPEWLRWTQPKAARELAHFQQRRQMHVLDRVMEALDV